MIAFLALVLFIGGCVGLVVYVVKRQNRLVNQYYQSFCQKYGLKVTAMGGTKLYDHPQTGGVYQGRPLAIISYWVPGRRASTLIEVGIQNPKNLHYAIFLREDSYVAYRSFSEKDRVLTQDPEFDKKYVVFSKEAQTHAFKLGVHVINAVKRWPQGLMLRVYVSGPVLSTLIDDVVMNDKKVKQVQDLIEAFYQLAPALEM